MTYEITFQEISPKIGNPISITSELSNAELSPVTQGSTYRIEICSINNVGVRGPVTQLPNYTVLGKTIAPTDISVVTVTPLNYSNRISWPGSTDIDILEYQVNKGVSWVAGVCLYIGSSSSCIDPGLEAGTSTYWVKAIDTAGNQSVNASMGEIQNVQPSSVSISYGTIGSSYYLNWVKPASTYALERYEIRTGSTWQAGVLVGYTTTNNFQATVDWNGSKTFMVAAQDIAGNLGTPTSATLSISPPTTPTITSTEVDNSVQLMWTDTKTSLPISYHEIRKGVTLELSTLVGYSSSLFTNTFENSPDTYTYWIRGVDTAGNIGAAGYITVVVNPPPNYVLFLDYISSLIGTYSSSVYSSNMLTMPHNTTETWQSHFSSRGWNTIQDQITAGYPIYAQPASASGFFEETIDYGTYLPVGKVSVIINTSGSIGGALPICTISLKANIGDPWVSYIGTTEVLGIGFRYIKVKVAAVSTGVPILAVKEINVKIDTKVLEDNGIANCVSTDSGGTLITFSTNFSYVTSIVSSVFGTVPNITSTINFVQELNPTGFNILVHNQANNRASSDISWIAKGY